MSASPREHLVVSFDWTKHTKRTRSANKDKPSAEDRTPLQTESSSTRSRKRIKASKPDKYAEYLDRDAQRNRKNYHTRMVALRTSPKQRDDLREKWRQDKKRQRNLKPKKKHIKDMTVDQQRHYMKIKQRERRQKLSAQMKSTLRRTDTTARSQTRNNPKEGEINTPAPTSPMSTPPSRSTIYRNTKKAKKVMPKSPRTYASVLQTLASTATPRKRSELHKKGLVRRLEDDYVGKSLQKTIQELRTGTMTDEKRKRYHLIAYASKRISHYGMRRRIATSLGIGGKLRRVTNQLDFQRKLRRDAMDKDTVESVQNFWTSEGISHVVPLKKRVKKDQATYVLDCNYTQAYKLYQQANPKSKIGYVKFIQLKPSYVKHLKAADRIVCCCKKCENMKLKLKVINKQASSHQMPNLQIMTIFDLSRKTLCPYDEPGFPKKACADRTCPFCGTKNLERWYRSLVDEHADTVVDVDEWKNIETVKLIKKKGQTEPAKIKRISLKLITTKSSIKELLKLLQDDMKDFSSHIFRAAWQQDQYRLAKQQMLAKSAVLVIDFAENYACGIQNEVQSYHWAQVQVTIHPVMAYINASDETSPEPTHTEAVFAISDDPKHDAAAVATFMELTYKHLKEKYHINTVILFSDCCACQYRGKISFADASFTLQDHQIDLSRHYFESSHGKSAADGLGAIVKHSATMAVTRCQAKIRNAKEFYDFCSGNLQQVGDSVFQSRAEAYKAASRTFVYVPSSAIKRSRPERDVTPVKGTMRIHSLSPSGVPYKMKTRDLSCFCSHCRYGQGLVCTNISFVGEWNPVSLTLVTKRKSSRTLADDVDRTISDEASGTESDDDDGVQSSSVNTSVGGGGDAAPLVGDFAAVRIQSRRACYIYIVEIQSLNEGTQDQKDEVVVKYLLRRGDNLYQWADIEQQEYSTEPTEMLICKIHPPTVLNARGQLRFLSNELNYVLNEAKKKHKCVYFK